MDIGRCELHVYVCIYIFLDSFPWTKISSLQEPVYEVKRCPAFTNLLDVKNNLQFVRNLDSAVFARNKPERLHFVDRVIFFRK